MKKLTVAVSESEDILRPESLWYSHTLCKYMAQGFTTSNTIGVNCSPRGVAGRFVGIMMHDEGALVLCEVQAFQGQYSSWSKGIYQAQSVVQELCILPCQGVELIVVEECVGIIISIIHSFVYVIP